MLRFPDPSIFVAACSTRHQLARQVRFLREENRVLRAKLPARISTTLEERSRLLRFGLPLGDAIIGCGPCQCRSCHCGPGQHIHCC